MTTRYLTGVAALLALGWFSGCGGETAPAEKATAQPEPEETKAVLTGGTDTDEFADWTLLEGETELAAGQEVFVKYCAACHKEDGGGMVGPNLTDPYWIHGNGLADIARVVTYGVPEKGMVAWGQQLSPDELRQVASYVVTLEGTQPAEAKEAQGQLMLTADAEWVYATAEDDGLLSIRTGEGKEVASVSVGQRPRGLKVSPDGQKVYVALSGSPKCPPWISDEECDAKKADPSKDGIAEVDVATRKVTRVLPGGSDPEQFDISPDGKFLYVANEDAAEASIVSLKSGKVVRSVPVGGEPEGVKVSPDGKLLYVASEADHKVTAIDPDKGKVLADIAVGKRPRDVIFSHDGTQAYVSNEVDGTVSVIDAETHTVAHTITLPDGAMPMGLALSPNGSRLYVANGRAGTASEIDLNANKVLRTTEVGKRPWGITVSSDGQRIYAANGPSAQLSVLSASTFTLLDSTTAGKGLWGVVTGPSAETLGKLAAAAGPAESASSIDVESIMAAGNLKKGAMLFNAVLGCAHCHGTNAKGHTDNRNLRYMGRRYGDNTEVVFDKVFKEGRLGTAMPPWDHLKDSQKKDLKAFVFSLQE